jgi:hypothetical protein
MFDSGCVITFTANKVAVKHGAATILTGTCDKESGLWRAPLGETTPGQSLHQHTAHNVYEKSLFFKTQLMIHMHVVLARQIKAIENVHFATWASLTVDNVCKYLPKYDAMVKVHMNQIRQHIRSTQTAVTEPMP